MSMMESQQTQTNDISIEVDSLPPRHTKHGRRRQEKSEHNQDDVSNRGRGLYYIQIILYTFLALIAAIIIYYYVNTQQQETMMDKQAVDPLVSFLEQEAQNGNNANNGELSLSTTEQTEENTFSEKQAQDAKEEWTDEQQVKDVVAKLPELVRPEQKKEYPEREYTGSSGEQDEIEEPPQETSSQPKLKAVHTVQAGETLYSITMKYYSNKDYINYVAKFNGIKDPTTDVKVGMKLNIPEP